MEILIGALCIVLFAVFVVQIGKARELASIIRNDQNEEYEINKFHAGMGVGFMVLFLTACVLSFIYYIPYMLGWGPNTAASAHGPEVDYLFNITLFFTAAVFFVTQFLLFWFAWKYRGRKGHRAIYWAHDERLEMVWMMIPAVVMTFLVVGGLNAWNTIMADVTEEEEYIEIEATGAQFLWYLRYPGRDGKLGARDFKKIKAGENELGQDWADVKNIDDFMPDKIVLPVGKKVRVRITARDVLHNFYLPQFRVKMDAVPGMPTYFVFTPTVTTDSMRNRLSKRPEWQVPDKNDPKKMRWETFEYELACAELCGRGHYSMRRLVKIVSQEEYEQWLDEQEKTSTYLSAVRGKDNDPFKGKELDFEKILAEKDRVNEKVAGMQTALDAAKKANNQAEVTRISGLMVELRKAQKAARTAMDFQAVKAAELESERILQQVVKPAENPIVTDSTAVDTAATPVQDSTIQ